MVRIYGISNCDTIKKTRAWLQNNEVAYEFHDYRKQGISKELITEFLKHFDFEELINRRGTTWRKLSDSQKQSLNKQSAIALMLEQPSIIKRPLLHNKNMWLLGFNEAELQKLV